MRGYEVIKEILENEIGNYPYFQLGEIRLEEENEPYEYYNVDITNLRNEIKTLFLRFNREKNEVEIQLAEDNYEKIEDYSWTIKYLWMALLKW